MMLSWVGSIIYQIGLTCGRKRGRCRAQIFFDLLIPTCKGGQGLAELNHIEARLTLKMQAHPTYAHTFSQLGQAKWAEKGFVAIS